MVWVPMCRLLSSSFLWFIFRILEGNSEKELLRSLGPMGKELHLELEPQPDPPTTQAAMLARRAAM